jgi:hypothetical protein
MTEEPSSDNQLLDDNVHLGFNFSCNQSRTLDGLEVTSNTIQDLFTLCVSQSLKFDDHLKYSVAVYF